MSTTSIYPPVGGFNLRTPMPIARTRDAPFFNGRYIEAFLNRILQHGVNAGILDKNELVKYIIEYSSDQVKDLILYMDEFDLEGNVSWDAAKEALNTLYGSSDKPKEYTEDELKEFCRERAAKPIFSKTLEVEEYLRSYVAIAASLKKRELITEKQYNLFFIRGIPHSMKEWFASATPEAKRTKENPPTISESLAILKTRFDKNSIIYEDWHKEEEEFAKYSFDENGNRVTTSTFLQDLGGAEAPVPGAMPQAKPKTTTTIDELTKQLEKLTIAVNAVKDGTVERVPQPPATLEELRDRVDQLTQMLNNGGSGGFRMNQGSDSATRRCFMCGGICGENGTHPIGLRFCPETVRLVNEHLVTFDPQRMRYVMPDGRDLPVVPRGWAGGVASFIRNNQNNVAVPQSSASVPRDVPPHMRTTNSVGLVFEDAEPQRQVRFESPPVSVQQPTAPAPPVIQQNSIPPPTNPINNEQGWKSSQPKNQKGGKDQDVEMKDKDKSPPGNQYHFTSKVQELADPQATFNRIGDMRVEVPLFQLLGMSPPLAKLFTESTRTKREYGPVKETVNKSAEYFSDSSEEQGYEALTEIYGTLGEESNEKHFCVMENDPKLDDLVFRCSNAMAQVPAK
ncbi:hypothetical protein EV361DRAFT_981801 [Lentinula raphanica]|nr:hypothetical protein EV361DRAFT_981801 [Lentinula raphanica]